MGTIQKPEKRSHALYLPEVVGVATLGSFLEEHNLVNLGGTEYTPDQSRRQFADNLTLTLPQDFGWGMPDYSHS